MKKNVMKKAKRNNSNCARCNDSGAFDISRSKH